MKLIWKGKFDSVDQLPVGNLPTNAVKFREPETLAAVSLVASIFLFPVFIIIGVAVYTKIQLGSTFSSLGLFSIWGILLAFLMVVPHELLHAIAFPKHSEIQVWYSLRNLAAFVHSTCPTSKLRFIYLSLLPNIIFGFIPLILWIFIPFEFIGISRVVFSFAAFSLLMGVGDFLNIYNAITQMPKNSYTQLSGFNSYWYLP